MNTLRTQHEAGQTIVDVTDRVRAFIQQFANVKEHALTIDGLRIVDTSGLIEVAREVHDFDGCHPYSYTRTDAQQSFLVESIITTVHSFHGIIANVKTVDGWTISVTKESLEHYRFEAAEPTPQLKSDRELQFEQLLVETSGMDAVLAERLVGYDSILRVRARYSIETPITVPRDNEYASPKSINGMRVRVLSVAMSEQGKSALLVVDDGWHSRHQTIGPVPLGALDFSIEAVERTPEWLAAMCTHATQTGQYIEDVPLLVEEFNVTVPIEGLPILTLPGRDSVTVVNAQYKGGRLCNKTFSKIHCARGVRRVGHAHKLVIDPELGQIYAVNTDTEQAYSIASLEVRPKRSWEYIYD